MDFDKEMWTTIGAVALAIVGVASLAVFLSKNSNTAGVLTAGGSALATGIAAAVSPITGASDNTFGSGRD